MNIPLIGQKRLFHALVRFFAPVPGQVALMATSEQNARDLVTEMHKDTKDFEIIQCMEVDEASVLGKLHAAQAANQAKVQQS